MNATETKKILKIIDSTYPSFMRERNPEVTLTLWQRLFETEPYELVENALMAFIATDTKGFAPMPGALKEKIRETTTPPESKNTEIEAWNLVLKAIRGANWHAEESFAKLPKDIRRLVGNPQTLRDWAMMPEDEVFSVVASNFQRSYRAMEAKKAEFLKIPEAFRISAPQDEEDEVLKIGEEKPEEETGNYVEMPQSFKEAARALGILKYIGVGK